MWSGREVLARYANGGNNAGVPPRLEHEFIAVVDSSRLPGNKSGATPVFSRGFAGVNRLT